MGCGCTAALGAESMNTYMGPVPDGVPNPLTPMLHSYPTRYHGPIYTRPMFDFPWHERPEDFAINPSLLGLGVMDQAYAACPVSPNSVFATNADIDAYCSCVSSITAQRLGLSMEDLHAQEGLCTNAFVTDRRMWRWIAAGGVAVVGWAIWRSRT